MNQINVIIIDKKGQLQRIRHVHKIETTWREKGHTIITIHYYMFGDSLSVECNMCNVKSILLVEGR